jgi:chitin disaccharide deacetylase
MSNLIRLARWIIRDDYDKVKNMETKKIREKMIISADDFDSHPEAKKNILLLAEAGKIDRVGIIINEKFSDEEIKRLLKSETKIDLHLIITDLKANHHKYGESALKRSFIFVLKYFLRKISPTKIKKEWKNQISEFEKKFGKKPDGLNSHQHIHFFPPYFKIILQLAKEHKINYVRFASNRLLQGNSNVYRILSVFQKKNKRAFRASTLQSSAYMTSLDWIRNFEKFTNNLPEGKIELVCHPERKDEFELIQKYF